ncbi:MAG: hypothetical protein PHD40_09115, partial [Syntrophomonadaceae bacterium]|nr:hypothetical protein [Syntrophomonadaceae bacterium]
MAENRYWVGALTGNDVFTDTSHWSLTSGGSSGASYPGSGDTAIFDENSFPTEDSGWIKFQSYHDCRFDMTGLTYADLMFSIEPGGTLSLQENLSGLESLSVAYGTLVTNNYDIDISATFSLSGGTAAFGSSTVTIGENGPAYGISFECDSPCDVTGSGAQIEIIATGAVQIDNNYGLDYEEYEGKPYFPIPIYITIPSGGGQVDVRGLFSDESGSVVGGSFETLSITGDGTVLFDGNGGETDPGIYAAISDLIFNGNTVGGLALKGGQYGATDFSPWIISKSTGTVTAVNCTIEKSAASGGATFNALTSTGNVDGGGNTGWNFEAINSNDFAVILPMPTLVSQISQQGFHMTLPMLQLESSILGSMQVVAELPVFTIATVINPHVNNYNIQLPVLSADASIRPFGIVVDGSLPRLSATSLFGSKVESTLPSLTGAGTIITGSTIDVDIDLPRLSAIVESQFKNKVDVNVRFPKLTCASTLFDIPVIIIAGTLPALTGRVGILNERDLTGVCLNTEINAISLYTGWDINSMCEFNGEILCASEDGIFINSGDTDDGVDIDAYFTLFSSDLGINRVKRIRKIYITGYLTGFLKVTSIFDTSEKTTYTVACPASLAETQVIIGTNYDEQGSLVGLKISNVDGSDFDIDTITMLLTVLSLHPKAYGQIIRGKFTLPS